MPVPTYGSGDAYRSGNAPGGLIARVVSGSPAERAGLCVGMRVLAAGGEPLRDIIDWLWLTSEDEVELELELEFEVERGLGLSESSAPSPLSTSCILTREGGEPWGIEFASPLFDGLRTCVNACTFCFMDMLPPGMRPALYARDDDYRLSFLQGNFVTLTNMSAADVRRVIDYRLSPLHISLHAVSPQVRRSLMGANHARGLKALDELLAAGIEVHVQIVAVPGINDGADLDATLAYCDQQAGILSVGIVPYGFTRYAPCLRHAHTMRSDHSCSSAPVTPATPTTSTTYAHFAQSTPFAPQQAGFTPEQAERLIAQCSTSHHSKVQLADEFFLLAGRPLPAAAYYGDFPQYEDGIGLLRSFVEEWESFGTESKQCEVQGAKRGGIAFEDPTITDKSAECVDKRSVNGAEIAHSFDSVPKLGAFRHEGLDFAPLIVTGTAFAPLLRELLTHSGCNVQVIAIRNDFFGGNVSVAGLLTAADIIAQLPTLAASASVTISATTPATASAPATPRLPSPVTPQPVILPSVMFNDDGLTLDDMSAADLSIALNRPVYVVSCTAQGLSECLKTLGEPNGTSSQTSS